MRIIVADQFEFDPQSEEHVEIAVVSRGEFPFPDVESFMSARLGPIFRNASIPNAATPFSDSFGYGLIRRYLERLAGLVVLSTHSGHTDYGHEAQR